VTQVGISAHVGDPAWEDLKQIAAEEAEAEEKEQPVKEKKKSKQSEGEEEEEEEEEIGCCSSRHWIPDQADVCVFFCCVCTCVYFVFLGISNARKV
jgi:hypothetical protein